MKRLLHIIALTLTLMSCSSDNPITGSTDITPPEEKPTVATGWTKGMPESIKKTHAGTTWVFTDVLSKDYTTCAMQLKIDEKGLMSFRLIRTSRVENPYEPGAEYSPYVWISSGANGLGSDVECRDGYVRYGVYIEGMTTVYRYSMTFYASGGELVLVESDLDMFYDSGVSFRPDKPENGWSFDIIKEQWQCIEQNAGI